MRRFLIIAALAAGASAFAPASSVLPSLCRSGAQGPAITMKSSSKDDLAAANLAQRRMVVGGMFALLAPLAGLPEDAEAAKSGGRVGGGSFRSKAPAAPPRSRAAPTAPTVITRPSVTVIQSAPAMPFGYGYGGGMFGTCPLMPFSAMRYSLRCMPGVFAPAGIWRLRPFGMLRAPGGGYGFGLTPGQFIGLSAIELAESIARENRRQAYLRQQLEVQQQLGKDQAQIDALQRQLAEVPLAWLPFAQEMRGLALACPSPGLMNIAESDAAASRRSM